METALAEGLRSLPSSGAQLASLGAAGLGAAGLGAAGLGAGGGIGGALGAAGANAIFGAAAAWVATSAVWLLDQTGHAMTMSTAPDLSAGWFTSHEGVMVALAGAVVMPMLFAGTIQAVYRQNLSQLLRSFLVHLPLALVLSGVAVVLVRLALSLTDALSGAVAGGSGADIQRIFGGLAGFVSPVGSMSGLPQFVLFAAGIIVSAAALALWMEMIVRSAAISASLIFLPLVLAALVWPAVSHWCRRLADTLAALVLSKFVIVAVLALGASALAGAGSSGGGYRTAASAMAGIALLVLAAFLPFVVLRLVPVMEAGAILHLEGARRRATQAAIEPLDAAKGMALGAKYWYTKAASRSSQASPGTTGGLAGAGRLGVAPGTGRGPAGGGPAGGTPAGGGPAGGAPAGGGLASVPVHPGSPLDPMPASSPSTSPPTRPSPSTRLSTSPSDSNSAPDERARDRDIRPPRGPLERRSPDAGRSE